MELSLSEQRLKEVIKVALMELMTEQKGMWTDVVREAMEDYALGRAIEEGIENKSVSRENVFKAFSNQ